MTRMDTQTRSDQPVRELSVETFAALTASPGEGRSARYAVTVRRVAGAAKSAGRPMRALLQDLSREGVSLITPEPLRGPFELIVPGDAGNQLVITCGHDSVREIGEGEYHVAGTFRYFSMLPTHLAAAA